MTLFSSPSDATVLLTVDAHDTFFEQAGELPAMHAHPTRARIPLHSEGRPHTLPYGDKPASAGHSGKTPKLLLLRSW